MEEQEKVHVSVLFIDDEVQNLVSFKAAFRRIYDEVFTAETAAQGLKILQKNPSIKVILSDQRMPEMTGTEFFASILNDYPEVIRILITGYSDISVVVDAINLGQVYRYLIKPWDEMMIKIAVDNAVELFEIRRKNKELIEKLADANKKLEFLARQNMLS